MAKRPTLMKATSKRRGTTRIDTRVIDEWDVDESGFFFDDGHSLFPPANQKIDVRWDDRDQGWEVSWRIASTTYRIVLHPDVAMRLVSALRLR